MAVMKIPKTVKWAEIRALIGDQRTEDIITLRYGPSLLGPPVITIRKNVLENMLAHMEGRELPGQPKAYYQAIPAVFRLYYRESPQAKGRFKRWLRAKIADAENSTENSQVAEGATQMVRDAITQTPKQRKRRAMKAAAKSKHKVTA